VEWLEKHGLKFSERPGLKRAKSQREKVAALNADWKPGGTYRVTTGFNDWQISKLRSLLPPGTDVQKVSDSVVQAALESERQRQLAK
jgi:hypothetical protein